MKGSQWLQGARTLVKRDLVLSASGLLAAGSSLFSLPKLDYIDFHVLGLLLAMMLVVNGFRRLKVLEYTARQLLNLCSSWRSVTLALVALPFFASMLVTNDVALLIFVPLALSVGQNCKLDTARVVIWQTLAANLGSAFTPMGNPQNLFIYAHYQMETGSFLAATGLLTLLAAFWLLLLAHSVPEHRLQIALPPVVLQNRRRLALFGLLLLICLLSVFRVFDYQRCVLIVVLTVALSDYKLFQEVDYSLLLTFVFFFIFIGNVAHLEAIKELSGLLAGGRGRVYLAGIVLSQFISNVPAAMLLAGFTQAGRELLLGVDVGGLGTLVASMASVISYKIYLAEHPHQGHNYLKMFLFYNLTGLAGLSVLIYVMILR
jgi:Na+/H+ antiporter NhaD/arsenite permease-like protein